MNTVKTEPTPGAFEIMSKWRSFEILNWLDTTNIGTARALFESGAELEKQRGELLEALCEILPIASRITRGTTDGEPILSKARAAIANAGGNP